MQIAIERAFNQAADNFRLLQKAGYDIVPSGTQPVTGATAASTVTPPNTKRGHGTMEGNADQKSQPQLKGL